MKKSHPPDNDSSRIVKIDKDGIPLLEDIVEPGGAAEEPPPSVAEIRRLARTIASEAAHEFARELEQRLVTALTPLLGEQSNKK